MSIRKNITPASYLVLTKDNKILLLRRYNSSYESGKYSFVAGTRENGETFKECLIRESFEEAGLKIKLEDIKFVHSMNRILNDNDRIDMFFTVNSWEGEITNMEPDKCDDLSWFDIDNLPDNIIPYIQQAIECIRNNIYYSEFKG